LCLHLLYLFQTYACSAIRQPLLPPPARPPKRAEGAWFWRAVCCGGGGGGRGECARVRGCWCVRVLACVRSCVRPYKRVAERTRGLMGAMTCKPMHALINTRARDGECASVRQARGRTHRSAAAPIRPHCCCYATIHACTHHPCHQQCASTPLHAHCLPQRSPGPPTRLLLPPTPSPHHQAPHPGGSSSSAAGAAAAVTPPWRRCWVLCCLRARSAPGRPRTGCAGWASV